MIRSMWLLSLVSFGMAFSAISGAETILDSSTKEAFPKEVSFEYNGKTYQLEATGVATRKKLIIKVYSIASYLQQGVAKASGDVIKEILLDENAKQLTMKWVRDVDADKMKETYEESFHKSFSNEEYLRQQANIAKFIAFFPQGSHKGDEFVLRWIPRGVVEVFINGKKAGEITDRAFAKGLWMIWFGEKSVVNRGDLVSLVKP